MDAARNISLPEPLLAEVQSAALAKHRSVDEVLIDAVMRYIEECSWAKLQDYGAERARTLGINESDIDSLIAESRVEQPASEPNRPVISATLDTSVYIRALHFGGPATVILGHARAGSIRIDISDAMVPSSIACCAISSSGTGIRSRTLGKAAGARQPCVPNRKTARHQRRPR